MAMKVVTQSKTSRSLDWRRLTMIAPCLGHNYPSAREARQAVGDQVNALLQCRASPACHRRTLQVVDRVEAHRQRMPILVEFNSGNERRLVFRAAPRLAGMHTTEVGVVRHDDPAQQAARLALGHGFKQFVLDPPSGAVTNTQMPLERERGDVALVLRDQVDGLEPLGQGQLGGVEKRAGGNRALRSTARALPVLAPISEKRGVRRFRRTPGRRIPTASAPAATRSRTASRFRIAR